MKKLFYLLPLFLIIYSSCNKSLVETGAVRGIVKDASTGDPIPFADVFLLKNEIGDGDIIGGGGPSEQIDYTTSDANGNFLFNFNYDKDYHYLCGAEKELFYDLNQEFSVSGDIQNGINVEVLLNPIAWLTVHYENILPSEAADVLGVNGYITDVLYGNNVDTTITYTVQGNRWNIIYWAIGYYPTVTDSVYCPSFDTAYFEILY